MRGEDIFLEERFGRKRPFKVPDGYFEGISARVMSQLPERRQRRVRIVSMLRGSYRYVAGIAACVCVAVLGTVVYMSNAGSVSNQTSGNLAHNEASYSDHFVGFVADYTMIDNDDMYSMMADY